MTVTFSHGAFANELGILQRNRIPHITWRSSRFFMKYHETAENRRPGFIHPHHIPFELEPFSTNNPSGMKHQKICQWEKLIVADTVN